MTTADALLQIGISPNVSDANLEPANLVDALALVAYALNAQGKSIAAAIHDLAEAVRGVSPADAGLAADALANDALDECNRIEQLA
jgi:hypothetical protein